MTKDDILEMRRIVEKYIPIGTIHSLCHVGIFSTNRCPRCADALTIRDLIMKLEIHGHIGK